MIGVVSAIDCFSAASCSNFRQLPLLHSSGISPQAVQLMASESYKQTLIIYVPNYLLTVTALLGSLERLDVLLSKSVPVKSISEYIRTPLQAAGGR